MAEKDAADKNLSGPAGGERTGVPLREALTGTSTSGLLAPHTQQLATELHRYATAHMDEALAGFYRQTTGVLNEAVCRPLVAQVRPLVELNETIRASVLASTRPMIEAAWQTPQHLLKASTVPAMPLARAFTDIGLGAPRAVMASLQVTPRLPRWTPLPGTGWGPVLDLGARLAEFGKSFVQQALRTLVPAASDLLDRIMSGEWWADTLARLLHTLWRRLHYAAVNDEIEELEEFVVKLLNKRISGTRLEAVKTVLLDDRFRDPDLTQDPPTLSQVGRWVEDEHRNWKLLCDTELRHYKVARLDAPVGPAMTALGELQAGPHDVETPLLNQVVDDPGVRFVLDNLAPQQVEIVVHKALDVTWEQTAVELGYPPGVGEQTRRRRTYLANEYRRRFPGRFAAR